MVNVATEAAAVRVLILSGAPSVPRACWRGFRNSLLVGVSGADCAHQFVVVTQGVQGFAAEQAQQYAVAGRGAGVLRVKSLEVV